MIKYALMKNGKTVATFYVLACAEIFRRVTPNSYIEEYETDRNIRITNE